MQIVAVQRVVIVIKRMFVSQAHAGPTITFKVARILGKCGQVVLGDVGIGVGDGNLVNPIGVVALGEGHFGARFERAFPDGIGKHQFGSVQVAVSARAAQDEVVVHGALLDVLAVGVDLRGHEVKVEVDAQFACGAAIIGIGEPPQRLALMAGLLREEMVNQHVVLKNILVVDDHVGAAQVVGQVGTGSHRVLVVYLPVDAGSVGQLVVLPRHGVRTILTEDLVDVGNFFQRAVLMVILMEIIHRTKHVNAVRSIVQPEFPGRSIKAIAQVLVVGQREIQTEAIALLTTGVDAHHRPDCGVILRSRVVDDLHIADVLAAQPLQFARVAQQTAVDIDERRALSQHLGTLIAARHAWHLDEHLAQCT